MPIYTALNSTPEEAVEKFRKKFKEAQDNSWSTTVNWWFHMKAHWNNENVKQKRLNELGLTQHKHSSMQNLRFFVCLFCINSFKKRIHNRWLRNTTNHTNVPFAHSKSGSKIVDFYTFFIQVISLSKVKLVPGLARAMGRTTNLSIIFSWIR